MGTRLPLVVILGATGTGKTKLSLELAQKFGGEIIGADSMQVYKALDIITAKATKEERSIAPHHMIDVLEPHEMYTVLEYRNRAVSIIDDLLNRNKLPIVVGGTNYYIESLLWRILVDNPDQIVSSEPGVLANNDHELSSERLHEKLAALDPGMAKRLHPNNKRKILRALEVIHQRGRKMSDILEEQQSSKGGSMYGGGLRYDKSLILWLQCDKPILDQRLDDRVDKMMDEGLLDELTAFHQSYNKQRIDGQSTPDYSKGVFQSIGFKEFHSYLQLADEERKSEAGVRALNEGIEQLKLVTRRYARRQNKWTVNRFLGRTDRAVPPIYSLDTSEVSKWEECVKVPAYEIVQSYLNNTECELRPLERHTKSSGGPNAQDDTYVCEVCDNRVFVGKFQWNVHLKSNRHKKRTEAKFRKNGDEPS